MNGCQSEQVIQSSSLKDDPEVISPIVKKMKDHSELADIDQIHSTIPNQQVSFPRVSILSRKSDSCNPPSPNKKFIRNSKEKYLDQPIPKKQIIHASHQFKSTQIHPFIASGDEVHPNSKSNSKKYKTSTYLIRNPKKGQDQRQQVRFKKKVMSKEEICEVKNYIKGGKQQHEDTESINDKLSEEFQNVEQKLKSINQKKSKTQYFNLEEIKPHNLQDQSLDQSQFSQAEKIQGISYQKSKSITSNNTQLHKRVQWLKEEIQMHLEKEILFEQEKKLLLQIIQGKQKIEKESKSYEVENENLKTQIQQLKSEVLFLKQEIQSLKALTEVEKSSFEKTIFDLLENKQMEAMKLKQELETSLDRIIEKNEVGRQFAREGASDQNGSDVQNEVIWKLMEEVKYLKIENRMLIKSKENLSLCENEIKRVKEERDCFKKKIISIAKDKERMKKQNKGNKMRLDESSSEEEDSLRFSILTGSNESHLESP